MLQHESRDKYDPLVAVYAIKLIKCCQSMPRPSTDKNSGILLRLDACVFDKTSHDHFCANDKDGSYLGGRAACLAACVSIPQTSPQCLVL